MARPTKLTKERQDIIVSAVYEGTTYEDACAIGGITYNCFRDWMRRGEEEGRGKYFKFFNAIRHAEALCRSECAKAIKDAGVKKGDWRAASEYLEKRDPANWAKQSKVAISGVEITLKWEENADSDDTPTEDAPGAGGDIPSPGEV